MGLKVEHRVVLVIAPVRELIVAESDSLTILAINALDFAFNLEPVLEAIAERSLRKILFAVLGNPSKELLLKFTSHRDSSGLGSQDSQCKRFHTSRILFIINKDLISTYYLSIRINLRHNYP